MEKRNQKWKILNKIRNPDNKLQSKQIIDLLLENRNLKTKSEKNEFLNPKDLMEIGPKELGIDEKSVIKSIDRIKKSVLDGEDIIIYGDYDADGICSTAIVWETLYKFTKNVHPHIPDRFSEGYGINPESIENLKLKNNKLKLIITVDNGIVAFDAATKARELGIDLIVTDHHQKDNKVPNVFSIVHTDKLSGSGVAWMFSREIKKSLCPNDHSPEDVLELATVGTVADQLPLTGPNRSIVKHGLSALKETKRVGLIELFRESSITSGSIRPQSIGTYEINYLIAPRLNAMGRLEHAIDSLRLICTKNSGNAFKLANHIGNVNRQRQKIVDDVLDKARLLADKEKSKSAIVLKGDYHEGVIGLAAGKLVEEFGRPAVVFSVGEKTSKASARSIPGFNIIEEIKKLSGLLLGCGGHPMAAGLSIETEKIDEFKSRFQKNSLEILNDDLLSKTLKIDMILNFDMIGRQLVSAIDKFKPFGIGNPSPLFATEFVKVVSVKSVGEGGKHLKISVSSGNKMFDCIYFNGSKNITLSENDSIDIAYSVEENYWNGSSSLQLNIKDLKYSV